MHDGNAQRPTFTEIVACASAPLLVASMANVLTVDDIDRVCRVLDGEFLRALEGDTSLTLSQQRCVLALRRLTHCVKKVQALAIAYTEARAAVLDAADEGQ